MPKAEGGCGPDSSAWLYLAKRRRLPLSLRDISLPPPAPRRAGGDGVRLVQRIPGRDHTGQNHPSSLLRSPRKLATRPVLTLGVRTARERNPVKAVTAMPAVIVSPSS